MGNLQALKLFWIRLIYAIQIENFSLTDLPPSLLHIVYVKLNLIGTSMLDFLPDVSTAINPIK
jgi:hypothetical protein